MSYINKNKYIKRKFSTFIVNKVAYTSFGKDKNQHFFIHIIQYPEYSSYIIFQGSALCAGSGHASEPHLDPGAGPGGGRGVAEKDLHRHLPAQHLAGGPHYLCLLLHLHPTPHRTGGHLRRLSRTDIRKHWLVQLFKKSFLDAF